MALMRANPSLPCQNHQGADHSNKRQQEENNHIDVHHLTPLRHTADLKAEPGSAQRSTLRLHHISYRDTILLE